MKMCIRESHTKHSKQIKSYNTNLPKTFSKLSGLSSVDRIR